MPFAIIMFPPSLIVSLRSVNLFLELALAEADLTFADPILIMS